MKYEILYIRKTLRYDILHEHCVQKSILKKLYKRTFNKLITNKYKNVYYSYSTFPKRLAKKAKFNTVNNPDDADLIVIPVYSTAMWSRMWYAKHKSDILTLYPFYNYNNESDDELLYIGINQSMMKYLELMEQYPQ